LNVQQVADLRTPATVAIGHACSWYKKRSLGRRQVLNVRVCISKHISSLSMALGSRWRSKTWLSVRIRVSDVSYP